MDSKPHHSTPTMKVRKLALPVQIKLDIEGREWDLYELSTSTLTLFASEHVGTNSLGQHIPWQMRVNNVPICDGKAEVLIAKPWRNGVQVALQVSSQALDLPAIIDRSRVAGYRT